MKRSDGFYYNEQFKELPNFVWHSDNFHNPINVRKELAKFNRIRPNNVPIMQVIIETIKAFFRGI